MNAPHTKTAILTLIRTTRAEWDAGLTDVANANEANDGPVKDIIAHVIWYEREMVQMLRAQAMLSGPSDAIWVLPTDERNAAILARAHNRPLTEVLAKARQVGVDLLTAVDTLTDEDLTDPARFPGMPSDWEPWRILAGNTDEHYPDHVGEVCAWLDQTA